MITNKGVDSYAPVMIPTMSRYEHFKRCLNSLMECTFADKTEVYIGLDYPSKDEQFDGYKKISKYLEELEQSHKFKALTVIRRKTNFGIGENGNAACLKRYLFTKYDRIIFSEDDNLFAPAFLDFINKGLTIFEKDKSVFAICGYRHFYSFKFDENTFFHQSVDFNAWGYGIWRNRVEDVNKLDNNWFKSKLSIKSLRKIRKKNGNDRCFHFFTFCFNKELRLTDIVYSVYLFFNKMTVIMPKESMVRNLGMDKSGENFHDINASLSLKFKEQPVYGKKTIDFIGSGFEYYDQNREIYRKEGLGNFSSLRLLRNIISFGLKQIFK